MGFLKHNMENIDKEIEYLLDAASNPEDFLGNNTYQEICAEPIPEICEKRLEDLKGIINRAYQYIYGNYCYLAVLPRAYFLLERIINNHPLENGNKRMAVVIFISYLIIQQANNNLIQQANNNQIRCYISLFKYNEYEYLKNITYINNKYRMYKYRMYIEKIYCNPDYSIKNLKQDLYNA